MYNGAYSISIPEGREDQNGYVRLAHKEQYRIRLGNSSSRDCDVVVDVDGKDIGTFRVGPYSTVVLERPVNEKGKFTFLRDGSDEAYKADLHNVSKANKGLIKATFMPEKPKLARPQEAYTAGPIRASEPSFASSADIDDFKGEDRSRSMKGLLASCSSNEYCAGGTGLTGKSSQKYQAIANLDYDDASAFIVLTVRLVGTDDNEVRSLKAVSSHVPPPVN